MRGKKLIKYLTAGILAGTLLGYILGAAVPGLFIGSLLGFFAGELNRVKQSKDDSIRILSGDKADASERTLLLTRICALLWFEAAEPLKEAAFLTREVEAEFGLTPVERETVWSVLTTIQEKKHTPDPVFIKKRLKSTLSEDNKIHLTKILFRIKGLFRQGTREEYSKLRSLLLSLDINDDLYLRYKPVQHENLKECYTLLGVSPSASLDEVKKVYRKLAADLHPDTTGSLSEEQQVQCELTFKRVRNAYDAVMESRS